MSAFKAPKLFIFPLLIVVFLLQNGCTSGNVPIPPVEMDEPATPTPTLPPDLFLDSRPDMMPGWLLYTNELAGFSFQYPEAWFGPEVYEVEDDLRIEIGSDIVYPYGTDRTEQIYEVKNSYYILIQYRPNSNNWTLDEYMKNAPWAIPSFEMLPLADGESRSTARSLETKFRDVELGQFRGVEYIATLSDTAQTERAYSRQVFLFDENLNILMIASSPNNVEVLDAANWKDDYRQVDEANQIILYQVMDSIVVE